jgi:hypothetical protein
MRIPVQSPPLIRRARVVGRFGPLRGAPAGVRPSQMDDEEGGGEGGEGGDEQDYSGGGEGEGAEEGAQEGASEGVEEGAGSE